MKQLLLILIAILPLHGHAADSILGSLLGELQEVVTLSDRLRSVESQLTTLRTNVNTLHADEFSLIESRLLQLEDRPVSAETPGDAFVFELENDENGYADISWKKIVREGQALQAKYYKRYEAFYSKRYGDLHGPGWHGSVRIPVIQIRATEPEYLFRETMLLPSRFQLSTSARWGSILRWEEATIRDTINWGTATGASIGLIVRAAEEVDGLLFRPFEQTIERVILQAVNGIMPVYIEANPDRFWMMDVKILMSEGALIGIKHGPRLIGPERDEHVWLTEPRFLNLQMEGPGSHAAPQAAMLLSGANIVISNLSLHYWMQGPYIQNDTGLLINGITMHAVGYKQNEQRPFIVSLNTGAAAISAVSAQQPGLYVQKQSWNTKLGGWYLVPGKIL